MASLRTRLELALVDIWQRRGPLAWMLAPISVLHYLGYRIRQSLYKIGVLRRTHLDVPVVVIGNLYVGGTGKTPLTVELARSLAARGWRPGIVSRGHGAAAAIPRAVLPEHGALDAGDEPLLIARATRMPVVVGHDRVAAGRLLRAQHPECDVVISDDGLQHWPLARDVEIALLHYRGLGNGWLLPAGPLREPRARLDDVDALVCNGDVPPIRAAAPRYSMQTTLGDAWPLQGASAPLPLADLAAEQRHNGWRMTAAAGIGAPDRFFSMLRAAGLRIGEMPLADHFDFVANPFDGVAADRILITEKDAVKCESNPALANDARIWVVPLRTVIDPRLVDGVVERLNRISRRNARGPSAA
jgi:tetraacyldisaccharide 4'-kinase